MSNKIATMIEKVYGMTRYSVVVEGCWSLDNTGELLDDEGEPIEDLFDIEVVTYDGNKGVIEVRNFDNKQSVVFTKENIEMLTKISEMSQ